VGARTIAVGEGTAVTSASARAPHDAPAPSPWIVGWAHLVPAGARVLDLACGSGRHARFFATRGARVVAVDRDAAALATMEGVAGIEVRVDDLEAATWPLAGERFDAIVVANYLFRPRLADLLAALADDGTLLYETFARGNEAFGRPANPDFLLAPGELLALAAESLTVVAFAQGYVATAERGAVVQRLAAVGRRRPWPPPLAADAGGSGWPARSNAHGVRIR
jgi:SAM-dependent methyltransferase